MRTTRAAKTARPLFMAAALAAAATVPAVAQTAVADCPATLRAYLNDRSLNARQEGGSVVIVRGGVEYVCTCYADNQPPDCRKKGSGAAGGMGGVDMSRFSPGQQMALMATQSLLQGLFKGIFSGPSKDTAREDALRAQEEMLRKQEEERQQALAEWQAFREAETKRIEAERAAARAGGDALLGQMGSSAGQAAAFAPVGGTGLDFQPATAGRPASAPAAGGAYPAPRSAVEQARCAAAFSDEALRLAKAGRDEEAAFMSRQAQKAMAGEPTEVPCPAGAAAAGNSGPKTPAIDVNSVLDLYNARIKDLFDISRKLAEVRKQKIDAQLDVRQAEARISEVRAKAAAAVKPEEKKEADDLLGELQALKADAENRQKIAEDNENACLADAKKAEDAVKELDAKLKSDPGKK